MSCGILYIHSRPTLEQDPDKTLSVHLDHKPTAARKTRSDLVVVTDFDGTITQNDTYEHVMNRFAKGDWRKFDDQYEKGEISLQECVRRQGALVTTPEMVLIAELERITGFRPNFGKLITYCRANRIPVQVASAGIDFTIRYLLRMKGWDNLVKLYAARAESTPEGIKFTFPRLHDKTSKSVKDDLVRSHKAKGKRVVYVGDGIRDIHALRLSDYPFVVKGSRLALLCRQQNIPAREITDFQEILNAIQYDIRP